MSKFDIKTKVKTILRMKNVCSSVTCVPDSSEDSESLPAGTLEQMEWPYLSRFVDSFFFNHLCLDRDIIIIDVIRTHPLRRSLCF